MTSMKDIAEFLQKAEDYAGRDKALREAFIEVGTAMADIVSLMEKQGPDTAKAIAAALKGISLSVETEAPNIKIDVKPTPIEVKVSPTPIEVTVQAPDIKIAAPVIHVMPSEKGGGWKFDIDFTPNGAIKGMTAKRI